MLPGDTLLEIFDWFLNEDTLIDDAEAWQTLGHVCRKWRNVVFGSPHRLKLRLVCTDDKPVRAMLDIWPSFPIIIMNCTTLKDEDNIVAALEHNDRVCDIYLGQVSSSQWDRVMAEMQKPFPVLTYLYVDAINDSEADEVSPMQTIPDSFLGGSAPELRNFHLYRIPFPGLVKLLPSATHLVELELWEIPHSGYISPEAMATALSALTSLESFGLLFQSPRSCPGRGRGRPPPPTRSVLPTLTFLGFKGVSEYLEDLVARIDVPLLNKSDIEFFPQLIFHTPRVAQFITRTLNFMASEEAHLIFSNYEAEFTLPRRFIGLNLGIFCRQSDWRLSMLAQVCSSSLPLISTLGRLYIHETHQPSWPDDIENVQWLELLRPFTTVNALYLSRDITSRIAPALQELVGERATEVLPALQSLFLEELRPSELVQEAIDKFVAARQHSNHPTIVVSHWDREMDKR